MEINNEPITNREIYPTQVTPNFLAAGNKPPMTREMSEEGNQETNVTKEPEETIEPGSGTPDENSEENTEEESPFDVIYRGDEIRPTTNDQLTKNETQTILDEKTPEMATTKRPSPTKFEHRVSRKRVFENPSTLTTEERTTRKLERVSQILQKLNLDQEQRCEDYEFQNTIGPKLRSKELRNDIITRIFFPEILTKILCRATKKLNENTLEGAGIMLVEGIQELTQKFGMNEGRIKLIRVMVGIIERRAIIRFPYENFSIKVFIQFINGKLPEPMNERNQLRERLATLIGVKQLVSRLRHGIWHSTIRTQRKLFRHIDEEIVELLDHFTALENLDAKGEKEEESIELERNMMAAFQDVDIDTMDMQLLVNMISNY